jgi:hypothetical protein
VIRVFAEAELEKMARSGDFVGDPILPKGKRGKK